ncbi:MAG: hypothetical protein P4L61_04275 [Candidatus Pacebacteria bacterium]|nr:hypothetical protein [Candidatus Paceibacterota bacterium]
MDIYKILLLIGGIFGFLGACIAFLITLNEYKRHDIHGKSFVAESFRAAAFTFIFFIILSVVIAFIFTKLNL